MANASHKHDSYLYSNVTGERASHCTHLSQKYNNMTYAIIIICVYVFCMYYVINSAWVYVYYIIIIYTVVSFERRGKLYIYTLCMARRLATTRAANKYLIFQTTSQTELLAAVFDPIIKSFSSYNPTPTPYPPRTDDTVE